MSESTAVAFYAQYSPCERISHGASALDYSGLLQVKSYRLLRRPVCEQEDLFFRANRSARRLPVDYVIVRSRRLDRTRRSRQFAGRRHLPHFP